MKGELLADPDKAIEDFVYFIFEHLADIVSAWEHDGMSKHGTLELLQAVKHASTIGSEVIQARICRWKQLGASFIEADEGIGNFKQSLYAVCSTPPRDLVVQSWAFSGFQLDVASSFFLIDGREISSLVDLDAREVVLLAFLCSHDDEWGVKQVVGTL
jgi:hypothetical protein